MPEHADVHGEGGCMRQKVLDSIKRKLILKMNDLLELFEKEELDEVADTESENVIGDIVDRANSVYEMQIYDRLTENEQKKLEEVKEALMRIDEGVYGKCVSCGQNIEEKRLVAIPEAKMCIDCKLKHERRRV
jgi:DnaK suppressor protein